MGTSTSSSGPGSRIPFDPPWLDGLSDEITNSNETNLGIPLTTPQVILPYKQQTQVAPLRRFAQANKNLGDYLKTSDTESLSRALGHYSKTGNGGSAVLASRMRVATHIGGILYNTLQEIKSGTNEKLLSWLNQNSQANLSADEIGENLAELILTRGGTLEEESCKSAIAESISKLLTINPDINIFDMRVDDSWILMELYLSSIICNQVLCDLGQGFERSRLSATQKCELTTNMQNYIKSQLSVQLEKLRSQALEPNNAEVQQILSSTIQLTFEVFEGEV